MSPTSFRSLIGLKPSTVSVSSKNSALVVIDAQGTYAPDGGLAISGFENVQQKIGETVDKYRKANAPVIWVQHNAGDAPIFNLKDKSGDFVGDLRPQGDEKIIVKQAPSSFTGTDLHDHLQGLGAKQIVLTGYMAHVCVTGTARSAMEHGYDTIIVKDGVGDRDIPSQDGKSVVKAETLVSTVLDELADAIGTVVPAAEIAA